MALHHDSDRPASLRRRQMLRGIAGASVASLATVPVTGRTQSAAGGDVLWRFETGDSVTAGATVVGGTVYTGSFDEHVYALDAETGRQQWRHATNSSVAWAPAVVDRADGDGKQLFAGTYGRLYALDASSGAERWQLDTAATVQVPSPAVSEQLVVVSDRNVGGVTRDEGVRRWQQLTRGNSVGGWLALANSSPTVVPGDELGEWSDEDTAFVTSTAGSLLALGPDDGGAEGIFELSGASVSSPTVVDGTVYFGSFDSHLYAFRPATAGVDWRFETGGGIASSPTVHDGTVYVGSQDTHVYAVDADSGEERWRFATGDTVQSSPTVAGVPAGDGGSSDRGVVFVGSDDGHVYAIDADSGDERWRFDTGDFVRSSPTVVDGTLFVGGWNGSVYALSAGVEGSSAGSRVRLGTLGHHHAYAGDDPQALSVDAGGAVNTPEASEDPADGDAEADDDGAGFGALAALAGLGGAGYLARRERGTRN